MELPLAPAMVKHINRELERERKGLWKNEQSLYQLDNGWEDHDTKHHDL